MRASESVDDPGSVGKDDERGGYDGEEGVAGVVAKGCDDMLARSVGRPFEVVEEGSMFVGALDRGTGTRS